jgi:hypothetical protein
MISITKGRLAGLASASALVATIAVASVPGATLAADADHLTGFKDRDGTTLTAKIVNPTAPVTGTITADGYDIAVYYGPGTTGTVTADISGAKYYGVVADGAKVNVTGSKVHDIGDQPVGVTNPLFGMQRGRAIVYINGASGTISGNRVYAFQKSGIEVNGLTVDGGSVLASPTTSASVTNNVVTGAGPTNIIAQNGIVIRSGANATVNKNTISNLFYTPDGTEAAGVLLYGAGRVNVQNNKISDVESAIDNSGIAGGHVRP